MPELDVCIDTVFCDLPYEDRIRKTAAAGYKAVEELIKVAEEKIITNTDDDVSADRLKNAAATKKLAIFDAFEILTRIEEEKAVLATGRKERG